ncbi:MULTISPECIES: hypothetical protein [Hymenobacter]|uniref:Phosphatidate cytidylyltransferase n=2 Tax=Hymenobacter TaxID=89966 RepID=A0ABS6X5E5_9BACT|nr:MULTISPECIES: hypothetical protein [Hymenobacter]MBO3270199.1 hypothetical protein [Hymenobacter defluvii]MBW3131058.1 hypothetical protein [Hymenobacter profundi]
MKNYRFFLPFFLFVLMFSVSSCDAIAGIFKAGAWTAVVGIFLVVLLLWWIVRRMRG